MPDMFALNVWLDQELVKARAEWEAPDHEPSLGDTAWIDKQWSEYQKTPKKKGMSFKEWLARKIKDEQ